ncbi:sensor histidine kinase [Solimonas marina]|uniref:histidine kinase n=1 Tax=Solimonas marina TaxID=2714601 RepID=A0A970B4E0_9GAMM|nr:HAMP domain-containing sensor histidine kinase [Solimonas marina]NKF22237.1 HAMP domain-containing histidine kinase [Solimonas marina]
MSESPTFAAAALPPEDLRALEAFRQSAQMTVMVGADGSVLAVSPAALAELPALEHSSAWTVFGATGADPAQLCVEAGRRGWAGGAMQLQTATGRAWFSLDVRATHDPLGGAPAYVINLSDLSTHRALEARASQSERTLQLVLKVAPVALLISDRQDGRLLFATAAASRLLALPEDAHGDVVARLYAAHADHDAMRSAIGAGDTYGPVDVEGRAFNGAALSLRISAVPCVYEGRLAIVTTLLDIDEVRRSERALQAALEHERDLNQLQRRFVSMLSHEFRVPLAVIDSSAQRMMRKAYDMSADDIRKRGVRIRAAVARLTETVDTLLEDARMAEGSLEFSPRRIDLIPLMRAIIQQQAELQLRPRIEFAHDESLKVDADPFMVEHMFANLLSNAVKYAPDSDCVWVGAGQQGDRAEIVVRDQGVGIPAGELQQICNRFFRASTSAGIPGTGLGLHLVRQLAERHGGELRLDSAAGAGTTATLSLPIHQAPR